MKAVTLSVLVAAAVMTACASTPGPRPVAAPAAPVAPPVNLTKVYFYPTQNQSGDQQDRDRYECHYWSVRETGFDPSLRIAPPELRAAVVPARAPGQVIGTAAAVGALIGAAVADPGHGARGAVVGAMAGAVVGSAAASADAAQTREVEQRREVRGTGRYEQQAAGFRRAMSACLEGRGYSVK
jgi:Spy/CpxP family protein refolding chaperone